MKYITVVLLATYFQVRFISGCDFNALSVCASILNGSSDVIQSQGLAAIPSSQQLTSVCGLFEDFRACYRPNLPNCQNNPYFIMTVGTIERTLAYLCEDGFETILKYDACWNRSDVRNATKTCYNTQTHDIRRHLEQFMKKIPQQQSRNLCGILEEAQACMRSSVEERCGSEAATVIETIIENTFVEVVLMMGCASDPDNTHVFGQKRTKSVIGNYSHWSYSTDNGLSVKPEKSSVILFVLPILFIVSSEWN